MYLPWHHGCKPASATSLPSLPPQMCCIHLLIGRRLGTHWNGGHWGLIWHMCFLEAYMYHGKYMYLIKDLHINIKKELCKCNMKKVINLKIGKLSAHTSWTKYRDGNYIFEKCSTSYIIKVMKTKPIRYHHILIRMVKIENANINLTRTWRNQNFHPLLMEMQNGTVL